MNKLIPIEFKSQRILTTEQLAEVYETESRRITENFSRNEKHFTEGVHYYLLQGEELKEFKNQYAESVVAKTTSKLYLWTERGANRHCKILDTDRAWEQFDNLEETYFRVKEQKQLSPMEILDLQYQALKEQGQKINVLEDKVEMIEATTNITGGQAQAIQKLVGKRVKTLCCGDESAAFNDTKLRKKVYSYIWRNLKDYFNVTIYHNILKKDYAASIKYIGTITLQGALLREVQEANNQILMNV